MIPMGEERVNRRFRSVKSVRDYEKIRALAVSQKELKRDARAFEASPWDGVGQIKDQAITAACLGLKRTPAQL
jgi:hypothetical protein